MTLADSLQRLERAFLRVNQWLIAGMMFAMATMVFANVVSRYVFGASLNWSEEVARFLMIWVTYLGAGLALREGQHVAIEYFQGLLPRRLHPYARGLVLVLVFGFLVFLAVVGFQFSEFAWRQRSPVMQWRMGAVYLAIPIGAVVFALHLLVHARTFVQQVPGGIDADADVGTSSAASDGGQPIEQETER